MICRRLRSNIFFWIALLTLAMTNVVHAAEYKPGSMGYLYDDCAKALVMSATPHDFLNTNCGHFLEGYGMGVLTAVGTDPGAPNPADPCAPALQKEYDRITGALCPHLPDYRDAKTPPATILRAASTIAAHWHERAARLTKKSPLKKQANPAINALITPGAFCTAQDKALAVRAPLAINPSLLQANWFDFVRTQTGTLADKYTRCQVDLQASELKETNFAATPCGLEITGFLAGLQVSAPLFDRPASTGPCAKPIKRLYDSYNILDKTCVTSKTDPARVARLFLARVDQMRARGENLGQSGLGAAGYQALYFGDLCRDQAR